MSYEAVITAESLKRIGLTEIPKPRYTDLSAPIGSPDISKLVNWGKAKMLIDPLLTAKFARFIPDAMIVDQQIDSLSYTPEWSVCITIRRDITPPVNDLITRVTGIQANVTMDNLMRYAAVELLNQANLLGTKRIGPPQVFCTEGNPKAAGCYPILGVMVKFDRTPTDGETMDDMVSGLAVIKPQ